MLASIGSTLARNLVDEDGADRQREEGAEQEEYAPQI
jgi:hypothetical protein